MREAQAQRAPQTCKLACAVTLAVVLPLKWPATRRCQPSDQTPMTQHASQARVPARPDCLAHPISTLAIHTLTESGGRPGACQAAMEASAPVEAPGGPADAPAASPQPPAGDQEQQAPDQPAGGAPAGKPQASKADEELRAEIVRQGAQGIPHQAEVEPPARGDRAGGRPGGAGLVVTWWSRRRRRASAVAAAACGRALVLQGLQRSVAGAALRPCGPGAAPRRPAAALPGPAPPPALLTCPAAPTPALRSGVLL